MEDEIVNKENKNKMAETKEVKYRAESSSVEALTRTMSKRASDANNVFTHYNVNIARSQHKKIALAKHSYNTD